MAYAKIQENKKDINAPKGQKHQPRATPWEKALKGQKQKTMPQSLYNIDYTERFFGIMLTPLQGLKICVAFTHGYVALRHVLLHIGALPLVI